MNTAVKGEVYSKHNYNVTHMQSKYLQLCILTIMQWANGEICGVQKSWLWLHTAVHIRHHMLTICWFIFFVVIASFPVDSAVVIMSADGYKPNIKLPGFCKLLLGNHKSSGWSLLMTLLNYPQCQISSRGFVQNFGITHTVSNTKPVISFNTGCGH